MNKCTEADYRFGTTGTLDGTQVNKLVLEGLFGPTKRVTYTRDLQDNGTLAELKIDVVLLDYPKEMKRINKGRTYQEEIDFLVGFEKRNQFICDLASTQKGNTLVLFRLVEKHGKLLYDMIRQKNDKVFYVHGDTDVTDREAIRGIVEKSDDAIIVASLGTYSTGINIRNLHNIVFAAPTKSQVKVIQSIGRGLRTADNGQMTKLYDICDDMVWQGKENYAVKHAGERIKMYDKEKFDYEIHKVKI
jgi:superfamily II DNA or RNA helicase